MRGYINWRVGLKSSFHAIVEQGSIDVSAETPHDTGRPDHVFQNQCPSYEKGYEFADSYVAVDVGRAGSGHAGAEFGVT